MNTRPVWVPVVIALAGGALVRITAVRASEVVFDRVEAAGDGYRTTAPAQAVGPLAGYNPETDALPAASAVASHISTQLALPAPVAPVVLSPLAVISRLTDAERVAVFTSADPAVCVWRGMAVAAQEIRSDDPRTADGFALLVSKGILAADRPAQILAP